MEIAEIFSYFHSRKPLDLCRDLSNPDNLMLSENGRLYLIDLGGAVNGYKYQHKVCTGTNGFAAPEQYEGKINAARIFIHLEKHYLFYVKRQDYLLFIQKHVIILAYFQMLHEETKNTLSEHADCTKKLNRIQKDKRAE